MRKNYFSLLVIMMLAISSQVFSQLGTSHELYPGVTSINRIYMAPYVSTPPVIDGQINDAVWDLAPWMQAQTYLKGVTTDWTGANEAIPTPPEGAFSGESDLHFQFKIVWDETRYYMLLRHKDDKIIYSVYNIGYPGSGAQHPFRDYLSMANNNPAIGRPAEEPMRYQSWRMDHISLWATWYNPAYLTSFTRNTQGVQDSFYPGAITSTNDTAIIWSAKETGGQNRTGEAAGTFIEAEGISFIEFANTPWASLFPTKQGYIPSSNDTILLNGEINDADGTQNRRDYLLGLSTEQGDGHANLAQAIRVVLSGTPPNKIYNVVAKSPNHTTLKAAIDAADLAETLKGDGPFTLFAPTNDAFAALPEGALDALLADKTALTSLLLKHVVEGEATSNLLSNGMEIPTVGSSTITITITGDEVFADNAKVTTPDVEADNGVVHVINGVLSAPVSVKSVKTGASFDMYPNPNATGLLMLNKVNDVTFYNLTGQEVLRSVNTDAIDISGLKNGVYIVKDSKGNVRKLVKK